MKNVLLFILTLVSTLFFAQLRTSYEVTKVEVYLSGAKVYTESKINLAQGENIVLIDQITNSWLPNTVQANVNNNTNLISVTPKTNFLQPTDWVDKEKQLYEQQNNLDNNITHLQIEKTTLEETIELINNNNKIGNTEQGWNPTQVQQLADYYNKKILELKKQIFTLDLQLKKLNEEKNKVAQQIAVESRDKNKNKQQLELIVDAKEAGSKTIEISYFVDNCGWSPNYDIKAQGKDKPIEIVYRGSVWQTTGVDWEDVQISLMSNQPNQDQNRPILNPIFVDFFDEKNNYKHNEVKAELMSTINGVTVVRSKAKETANFDDFEEAEPVAFVNNSDVNVTYDVKGLHDVLSDGTQKILIVDTKEVNGKFSYHAVPKLDEKVFLLAYLKDWNQLNFMAAEANIYYQNNYIGKVHIDPNFSGEEYPLSLGADERISIKRIKNKDFSTVKWLNSSKKEEYAFDITIRNNSNTDVDVEVIDQIPLSKQIDIEVELLAQGNAEYFKENGFLSWKLPIKKGTTQKVSFKYEIKYPKNKTLNFQN